MCQLAMCQFVAHSLLVFLMMACLVHCEFHDSVDDVAVVLLEGFDRFISVAVGLLSDEIDVLFFKIACLYFSTVVLLFLNDSFLLRGCCGFCCSLCGGLLCFFKLFRRLILSLVAEVLDFCLTEYHVSVTTWVLEHLWLVDNEKHGFALPNSHSRN